ncbi:MAG: HEPN domain-containing protein [Candidatus Scalindua sp. AMX11]|nr:MAG: HEPN domain-containing protein [Candidatus Scalindua sp.]NOG84001.1 HEPN domain-containing protein [Planctomycetota bacterium]RZV88069.1 MAG: HEPN domain-containing protein [Candidatus Scalindua sp. SCAELEC01]TDE64002.1 MAG: HEPN domain-containing protein [Candidatus Scalindua sp. AMX11]GJQ60521.1 MAG: DNA-binding protein [Candidatus Scalindua sp.]
MSRYQDWLKQAANDLEWAKHSLEGEFYAQTCFISQQAGEKALKAFCFYKGFDIVKTHSLFQIVRSLKEDGKLEKNAKELDIFYISGRYPDAFPEGAPFELITKEQAERALSAAVEIYDIVVKRLGG